LLLIYAIVGSIGLIPGLVSVLVTLLIKALHIFNATLAGLKAERDWHEGERKRVEQEKERLLRETKDELKSAICLNESLAETTKELQTEIEDLKKEAGESKRARALADAELVALKEKNGRLSADVENLKKKKEALKLGKRELKRHIKSLQDELDEDLERVSVSRPVQRPAVPAIKPSYALPDDLRDVDPRCIDPFNGTCIGLTLKNKRCNNSFISGDNKKKAADILNIMRSEDPGHTLELPSLGKLSNALLCPRWHNGGTHDQTDRIANAWYRLLKDARAALGGQARGEQGLLVTPARSKPTKYLTNSAGSSFSSGRRSPTFSAASYPSTAATTPESDDEERRPFDPSDSPTLSRRR
jgi:FtsZ-binding cell division protein ZapB